LIERIRVRVVPRASRNQIEGFRDGVVAVKLTAPPIEGAANKALVDFLACVLGVKKSQVRIVSGEKSREKVLEIDGLTAQEILRRIDAASASRA